MLVDAFFLTARDLKTLLRRRETLLWTFVMPVIFFYFIGSISGGYGRLDAPDPIAVATPIDAGFLADELLRRLERNHFRIVHEEGFFREIRIPAGFTASLLAGQPVKVRFFRRGSGVNADFEQTRVNRAVYSLAGDVATIRSRGGEPSRESFEKLAKQPRPMLVEVTSAGKQRVAPIGFNQAVPGILVMFTLLVLFTVGGVTIQIERRQGILRRLASAPLSRSTVVLAKWGTRMTLGFIQIIFAMITGTLLFRVHWGDHLGAIMLVLAAYASLAAALGLLIGNLGQSEGQVVGIGVVVSNIMAALGGCWWPIEITPAWSQRLALVFPTGWAMDALHKLMSFGASPAAVAPHISAFLAAALLTGYILKRNFRFE